MDMDKTIGKDRDIGMDMVKDMDIGMFFPRTWTHGYGHRHGRGHGHGNMSQPGKFFINRTVSQVT
jgi:hypothetical protein